MAVKYYCDRCGKETKELYDITVYFDYEKPGLYRGGLCKKCLKEISKKIEKADRKSVV